MMDKINIRTPLTYLVSFVLFLFIVLTAYLSVILRFDAQVSDVAWYWKDSLDWRQPYNIFHVPGYPLIIALLRAASFNKLPPILLMRGITLIASIISVYSTYKITQKSGCDCRWSIAGSLLLILWPFVGLTYAVYPVADLVAIALFLLGLMFLENNHLLMSCTFFGLTLITHKAMWPFVIFLVFLSMIQNWKHRQNKWFLAGLSLFLPLLIIWGGSSVYHHNPLAMIESNMLDRSSAFSSGNYLFASILGIFQEGGIVAFAKSVMAVVTFVITIFSLIHSIIIWNTHSPYILSISLSILLLYAFFNFDFIFYVIRFSRLLALPLVWLFGNYYPRLFYDKFVVTVSVGTFALLILTQFIMIGYLPKFFS